MPESETHPCPASWAIESAALPLAFAQVREDPRLDLELAATLPEKASVTMIASGGETALCLARLPLSQLPLVDINPAQLALTRCKFHLAKQSTAAEAAALLGHLPMLPATRSSQWQSLLGHLNLEEDVFGPPDFVAHHGPDHSGRYERAFAHLREQLMPRRAEWEDLLQSQTQSEAAAKVAPHTELGQSLDLAFAEALSLPNLIHLFGTEATQNPCRPFHEHFASRTRVALARFPATANPFLWQIFAGCFSPNQTYDWLQDMTASPQALRIEPSYHCGKMADFLDNLSAASQDLVHLSNILDWLSPPLAETTLHSAARALKPGGRLIIRQLNSSLDIASLGSEFVWDHRLATEMEARDRSFFYPKLLIGARL